MQKLEFEEILNYFDISNKINKNTYMWNGYKIEYFNNNSMEYNSMGENVAVSDGLLWETYITPEDLIDKLLSIVNESNKKNTVVSDIYNNLYKDIKVMNLNKFGKSLNNDNIFRMTFNNAILEFDVCANLFLYDIKMRKDLVDNLTLSFSDINCSYMKVKDKNNNNYIEVYEDINTSYITFSYTINNILTVIKHKVNVDWDIITVFSDKIKRTIVYTNSSKVSLNDFIFMYNELIDSVIYANNLIEPLINKGRSKKKCKD